MLVHLTCCAEFYHRGIQGVLPRLLGALQPLQGLDTRMSRPWPPFYSFSSRVATVASPRSNAAHDRSLPRLTTGWNLDHDVPQSGAPSHLLSAESICHEHQQSSRQQARAMRYIFNPSTRPLESININRINSAMGRVFMSVSSIVGVLYMRSAEVCGASK
jgi:hypothetical protein